jgi:hypothetical protein
LFRDGDRSHESGCWALRRAANGDCQQICGKTDGEIFQ